MSAVDRNPQSQPLALGSAVTAMVAAQVADCETGASTFDLGWTGSIAHDPAGLAGCSIVPLTTVDDSVQDESLDGVHATVDPVAPVADGRSGRVDQLGHLWRVVRPNGLLATTVAVGDPGSGFDDFVMDLHDASRGRIELRDFRVHHPDQSGSDVGRWWTTVVMRRLHDGG